jgi:hypothetical protein
MVFIVVGFFAGVACVTRPDGPLTVITFVRAGGACAEPMSDLRVLAMPP